MPRYAVIVDKQYLQFCCAHFVTFGGRREPLHGHNYHCRIRLDGALSDDGYVVDFGVVKRVAKRVCDDLDHTFLLPGTSRDVRIERTAAQVRLSVQGEEFVLPSSDVRVLPIPNTTAEYLAAYLGEEIVRQLPPEDVARLGAIEISVGETPGQRAIWRRILNTTT